MKFVRKNGSKRLMSDVEGGTFFEYQGNQYIAFSEMEYDNYENPINAFDINDNLTAYISEGDMVEVINAEIREV